jgi:hypothetical protein
MSRQGRLLAAEHSGHHIQVQEPQLVATSIRRVLSVK